MTRKLTLKSYIQSTIITIFFFAIGIILTMLPSFGFSKIWQWVGIAFALAGLIRSFYTRWQYRTSEWFKIEKVEKNGPR